MEFGKYKDSIWLLNKKKTANCNDCFYTSPFVKYVLPSFLVVLLILTFTYFGLLTWLPLGDADSQATCHLQPSYYVSCLPDRQIIPKDDCLKLGCCWREDMRICYHSFPSRYGYKVDEYQWTSDGLEGSVTATRMLSPAGKPARGRLGFSVRRVGGNDFRIVLGAKPERRGSAQSSGASPSVKLLADYGHIFDFLPRGNKARVAEFSLSDDPSTKLLLHEPHFALSILRGEDELVFSTARGPLIMTDNYWELTLYLASGSSLQGLGALQLNGTTNWIYNNENRTIKPALLALRSNVACQLNYQAPIEIQVLNGSNLVIVRGISIPDSGFTLNLYSGSSASRTIAKLSDTRNHSRLLSVDRIGLQLCPDNHGSLKSAVDSLKRLLNSTEAGHGAPWDSHCLSRQHLGPTLEPDADLGLVAEARGLLEPRALAAHLTPMLVNRADSPLQSSLEKESCLLGNATGGTYVGTSDARDVVYPDWTEGKARQVAAEYLEEYLQRLQLGFVVTRDAWPRDQATHGVSGQSFDYLPEELRSLMSSGTLPFDLQRGRHYTVHNAYAPSFADFAGAAGVELRGHECNSPDVEATWSTLRGVLEAGVLEAMTAQVPNAMYVCGANRARIDDELCVRWYALAVAWPRILAVPEKSPLVGTRLSRSSAIQVANLLKLRATLTTYHRTTLASFAKDGSPILADTAVHFPDDRQPPRASQFLWGDSILVGLVLLPRHYQVPMWLPSEHPWRHMQGGSPVGPSINGSSIPVTVPMGKVALLVRPGRIIPVHKGAADSSATTSSRNLSLVANPICDLSSVCQATGRVYFGDDASTGEFLLISYSNGNLALSKVKEVQEAGCGRF
ncbi:uncharacterized protein LOC131674533 isoform X2 [Phymastichus coffea]|uniref:uncharacterized protein LOC131674533 isoform X2 n=1 Tax=Phymastichus coffea TaxID=108790 RepID=UPI00273C5A5A|nr:uncharacterized protein LOC131674533 isoform X2 [Phymastichus coffea]